MTVNGTHIVNPDAFSFALLDLEPGIPRLLCFTCFYSDSDEEEPSCPLCLFLNVFSLFPGDSVLFQVLRRSTHTSALKVFALSPLCFMLHFPLYSPFPSGGHTDLKQEDSMQQLSRFSVDMLIFRARSWYKSGLMVSRCRTFGNSFPRAANFCTDICFIIPLSLLVIIGVYSVFSEYPL